MKKILIVISFVAVCHLSMAQEQAFTSSDFVWCGVDFSNVKLVGAEGFNDVDRIKDYFFDEWNQLLLDESDKYDFADAYYKDQRYDNISKAKERNLMPNVDELVTETPQDIDDATIKKIAAAYKGVDNRSDLGLVYIVEDFNKTDENGKINVVFFDMNTGNVEWMKEYNVKPGGFGFRNYWARTIYEAMDESSKDFKKARKKYK